MTVQITTQTSNEQARRFQEITSALGTTPSDALRMFIAAFNERRGFPYEVRTNLDSPAVEPFTSEADADEFATNMAMEMINAAR